MSPEEKNWNIEQSEMVADARHAIEVALSRVKIMENDTLIDGWLTTFRNEKTRTAYSYNVNEFAKWLKASLLEVERGTLAAYAAHLAKAGSVSAQSRALSALRSFYRYLTEEELIAKNPAAKLELPKAKDELAQRIITEAEFHKLLTLEENPRNKLLIELLYATGGRISEALSARWQDATAREDGGQIVLFGKRDKTRTVLIPASVWAKLIETRGDAGDEACIFPSPRTSGHLSASQAWRIVRRAALVAGLGKNVSPHWFRHAHASHAIDRGAPLSLVKETLGHSSLSTTSRYVHARPDDSSGLYLSIK